MSNKGKYKTLSGKHADSNKQVILETWDIQEQKLKTSHLGLPDFLNRHFMIKKRPRGRCLNPTVASEYICDLYVARV